MQESNDVVYLDLLVSKESITVHAEKQKFTLEDMARFLFINSKQQSPLLYGFGKNSKQLPPSCASVHTELLSH